MGKRLPAHDIGEAGAERLVVSYQCAQCGAEEAMADDEEEFLNWDERWNPPDAEEPEPA
jgi:hypothetical protein